LQDENGRLRKVLAEKEYEMNQLKKKLSEERDALGSLENNVEGVAAMKIVELAKKVRELTAQYEAEKTRNKQLTKSCAELENKCQQLKEKRSKASDDTLEEIDEVDDENEESTEPKKLSLSKEIKELKEKFNQTSHKMMEYKSQCEILKQDLKRTQKVLGFLLKIKPNMIL
jgi:chromosome segregation ATPase